MERGRKPEDNSGPAKGQSLLDRDEVPAAAEKEGVLEGGTEDSVLLRKKEKTVLRGAGILDNYAATLQAEKNLQESCPHLFQACRAAGRQPGKISPYHRRV